MFPSIREYPIQPISPATELVELLTWLLPLQSGIQTPRQKYGEEKKSDDIPAAYDRLGITTPELKSHLQMYGKAGGGTFDSLLTGFQHCGEIGLSEQYKKTIIRKKIMNTTHYDDVEVLLSSLLLNIALNKNWVGKYSNITCSSLVNATNGLSLFLVLDMMEE